MLTSSSVQGIDAMDVQDSAQGRRLYASVSHDGEVRCRRARIHYGRDVCNACNSLTLLLTIETDIRTRPVQTNIRLKHISKSSSQSSPMKIFLRSHHTSFKRNQSLASIWTASNSNARRGACKIYRLLSCK